MPPILHTLPRFRIQASSRCLRPSATRVAALTQSARPRNGTDPSRPPRENENKAPNQEPDKKNGRPKRRFAVPALVLFGVAIPLGWYLKNQLQTGPNPTIAHPSEFVKYTLLNKENVSSTCAIFSLRPSGNVVLDLDDPTLERAITSVEFKQPQLQIARSYTCLPQQDGQPVDEIRFLIRREAKGEVSNFLHRLPTGAEIEVRGLHSEYTLPDDVKSVVFLVGGTGIAPAMQVADALEGTANVYILWANRRREDCIGGYNDKIVRKTTWNWWSSADTTPAQSLAHAEQNALVSILESLKKRSHTPEQSANRLMVDYYVDEEGTRTQKQDVKDVLTTLSGPRDADTNGNKVVIVSGPPGFIAHWAGAKRWADGKEVQGPLGGVLSAMDLKGWQVVKL